MTDRTNRSGSPWTLFAGTPMSLYRRARNSFGLVISSVVIVLGACGDRDPVAPGLNPQPSPPGQAIAHVECVASISQRQVTCSPISGTAAGGASAAIIVGGQNEFVTLTSSNVASAGGIFSFDVTVTNLLPQPMGTEDGVTVHPDGVRTFFHTGPNTTAGTGAVSVLDPDGVATFTATNQPYYSYGQILQPDETSAPRSWQVSYDPGVEAFAFTIYVSAPVQHEEGWVGVTPESAEILPDGTVQLSGIVYDHVGRVQSETITWGSTNEAVATVDVSGLVSGVGAGVATITASATITRGGNPVAVSGSAVVTVNTPIVGSDITFEALANRTLAIDEPRGLRNAVVDPDGGVINIVSDTVTTAAGGTVAFASDGAFTYLTAPGVIGRDSVEYTAIEGADTVSAWLKLVSERRVWHVRGGEPGGGDGTDALPLPHLTSLSSLWAAGDMVLVESGDGSAIQAGVTLPDSVGVIGEGIVASLSLPLNGQPETLLMPGVAPVISRSTAGAAVTLGLDNTLRGLSVQAAAGAAIAGATFGTLTTSELSLTAVGPALDLNGGMLAGSIAALTSLGSATRGLSLVDVGGALAPSGGAISSATTQAIFVSGGSVTLTYPHAIAHSGSGPLLRVEGAHTGTVALSGSITGTTGTGLSFDNADGGYTVSPSATLTLATPAAIDIANGSDGTFEFSSNVDVSHTSGAVIPFTVSGSAPTVTVNGDVAKSGTAAGALVNITDQTGGTVTFQNGTLSATAGDGILLSNADGTTNFNGTTTLNGGNARVRVLSGSNGSISFASTSSITNPTDQVITVQSSAPTFTYSGSFTKNNNANVGVLVQNNTGGTISLTGAPKTLSTGTGNAINVLTNAGSAINLQGGSLAITTTTGTGLNVSGGGTIQVTGAGNTIASSGGIALNVTSTTIGASGLSFQSISANGGPNGIVLSNTGATSGLRVTGSGAHGSGGTIQNTTGADGATAGNGVYLLNAANVDLSWMNFSNHTNHAIYGSGVTNFNLTRGRITGVNGTSTAADEGSVSFNNLYGSSSITSSYIEGGFEDNVRIVNGFPAATTASLNRFTMTADTIGHNGVTGNNGVLIAGYGNAVMNATIENSRFTGSSANNIGYVINENASGDIVIRNNVLTNNHPNRVPGNFGMYVAHASNGGVTYLVDGNSVRHSLGSGIEVDRGAGGTGAMTGSITNNTVGAAGEANSGSEQGSSIFVGMVGAGQTATHTTTVSNNVVRQFTNFGIYLYNSGTGNNYLNATVQNNNIAVPSPNSTSSGFPTSGFRILNGTATGHDGRMCLVLTGNTVSQTSTSISGEVRVWGRFATRTAIPGLAGDVNAFLAAQNTITPAGGSLGAVLATSTNPFQTTCPPV